jgi:hypothetical protein
MFRLIFQIILCFNVSFTLSQSNQINYPSFSGLELGEVLKNSDWKILCEAKGYLNAGTALDFTLILESKKELKYKPCKKCKIASVKPRIIVVVIDNLVAIQNNSFIARGDEGGMLPYLEPEISIKDKKLTILWQYTRDSTSYIFEYDKSEMILITARKTGVHSATGNYESYYFDFKNRVAESVRGNISEEDSKEESIKIKNLKKLKSLSNLKQMYDWEVIPNILL